MKYCLRDNFDKKNGKRQGKKFINTAERHKKSKADCQKARNTF